MQKPRRKAFQERGTGQRSQRLQIKTEKRPWICQEKVTNKLSANGFSELRLKWEMKAGAGEPEQDVTDTYSFCLSSVHFPLIHDSYVIFLRVTTHGLPDTIP